MWHSEADIMKDLASIDDFSDPERNESFKVLYSFGRGIRTKQVPKLSNTFIDSRTGEAINVDNIDLEVNDMNLKSRGRGSVLSSFCRSKSQLQKQLRLARPLGSSDDAVESFFRRHMPAKNQKNSMSTSDSESDSPKKAEISDGICNSPFNSIKARQRVKAIRNSKLQHNALISNLLSKAVPISGSSYVTEQQNFGNNDGENGITATTSCFNSIGGTRCNDNTADSDIEKCDSDKQMKMDDMSIWDKSLGLISDNTELLNEKLKYEIKVNPMIKANFSNERKETHSANEINKFAT